MSSKQWIEHALSSGTDSKAWELFHENSKLGRYSPVRSEQEIRDWLSRLHDSLPFVGYPVTALPKSLPDLKTPLTKAILSRTSIREFVHHSLTLKELATLLHYAYGVSRNIAASHFVRPLRVAPSAGGLYPLEIFFHSCDVKKLSPGLYHYNPSKGQLRHIREGDHRPQLTQSFLQDSIPRQASVLVFITALFERSVYKYADRGYRYALLEAGHVAQNMTLIASALRLGCVSIGGFVDREIDEFLQLDGIAHSTIYVLAIGKENHEHRRQKK
jgi:SagB-type dehydrogenase family enzyme